MNNQNRFARISKYIVSLDCIHGIMMLQIPSYQIYITYADKTSVALEFEKKQECEAAMDKLTDLLNAI